MISTSISSELPAARPVSWQPIPSSNRTPTASSAGIETRIGNHTFRATGITAYLKNSGKLEVAQQIANHESPRTTKLYDRRQDEISLDEIERIIVAKLAQRSLALAMLPGITRRWSLLAFPMPSAAAGISVNAHAAEHANCRS
jgi:hypothetical protein